MQFFMARMRCLSGTGEFRLASKRRSRGNTPGKVTNRILVLLLMFGVCAEVCPQPSSSHGSETSGVQMSLKSTETKVNVEVTVHNPNVKFSRVILQEGSFIRQITIIDHISGWNTDSVPLLPCCAYTVTIQPLDADENQIGKSQSQNISTKIAAPPAVTGLASQSSAENITLTWQRPVTACEITAYDITYSGVAKWGPRTGHTGSATIGREDANGTTSVDITGLQPYTDYTVTVTATTAKGDGEPTIFNTTTKEAAPTQPTNLEMSGSTANTVSLKWQEPNELKGVLIGYNVSCSDGKTQVFRETTLYPVHTIVDLAACTEYTVQVAASTAGGRGNPTTIEVETRAKPPPHVTYLSVRGITPSNISLVWKRPATACEITAYSITYSGVAKTGPRTGHNGSATIDRGKANHTTRFTIDGLQPYTDYTVTLTASTAAGVGAAARIDHVAAGTGDEVRTAASREENIAHQRDPRSNTAPPLVAGPTATLIVSVMVSLHVACCCSLLYGIHV